jgi:1-deoxy-D-xylulose-5-phosphate synthase
MKLPMAIRYPRGQSDALNTHWKTPFSQIKIGTSKQISFGKDIAVLTIGTIGNTIIDICKNDAYAEKIAHYNMRFAKPLDDKMLHAICEKFDKIITIEDGTIIGGFGSAILEFLNEHNYQHIKLKRLGIPDKFIEHGKIVELHQMLGLDKEAIIETIDDFI